MAKAVVATIIFDLDQHGGDGNDQQDVNKITYCEAAHQPQRPQHYEYNSNRPQHLILLHDCSFPLPAISSQYQPAMIIQSNDKISRLGEMTSIIMTVIANGLPIAEGK